MSAQASKKLLNVLKGNQEAVPPIWLMRQAGRYLPEYRALRAEKGGFLALAYDSDAATEITLQPIKRFGFDGAILFSDILVIPHAMGQRLAESRLEEFVPAPERLAPVIDTVRKVSAALPTETTFLGFAGSPWTVATYMVHGQGSKDQAEARRMAHAEPERFAGLIEAIISATVDYLANQIDAGVDAVQLFDSWAGSLSPAQFQKWVIAPNAEIVRRLKARNPNAVIIGFPKGAGGKLAAYAEGTGVDALGLDETVDPYWANRELPKGLPVQGNLDPLALIAGGQVLKEAADNILSAFADRPHIFNLGHGILPDTPIENVEMLLKLVRKG
jgi:uroporphyrinogen decarboxylase